MGSTSSQQPVNTKKVEGHRTLRFNSASDVLNDAEKLAAAERAGTLKQIGNWPLGVTFNHLGEWINYEYDGYPAGFKVPPRFVCFLARLLIKKRFLNSPMPRGFKFSYVKEGTFATQDADADAGFAVLKRAWERLERETTKMPHPIFGPLKHEEWIAMHLRHAELHLGYYDVR